MGIAVTMERQQRHQRHANPLYSREGQIHNSSCDAVTFLNVLSIAIANYLVILYYITLLQICKYTLY